MSNIPDINAVLSKLEEVINVKVDPDAVISELNISSLDLVEWTVLLEDEYQVSLEDLQISDLSHLTPRLIYESVFANRASR